MSETQAEQAHPATGPPSAEGPSLGELALRGGTWVLLGEVGQRAIRLGASLITTRLLFEEAFGLIALTQILVMGVPLFTDLGIRPAIITHERGDDREFLDTAWTIQVLLGAAGWLAIAMLAWPVASFYQQPQLVLLTQVLGAQAFIRGLRCTASYSLVRYVKPGRGIAFDLIGQVVGVALMIAWAAIHRSVWALAVGALFIEVAQTLLSYRLIPGYRNRFRFDPEVARWLWAFGRWILISTSMTFLLMLGDRMVFGRMIPVALLGVYHIAALLGNTIPEGVHRLSGIILHPVYTRLSTMEIPALRRDVMRYRSVVLAISLPPLWVLAVFGPELVDLLFDDRYLGAGWMLQIMAAGYAAHVVGLTSERVLLAHNDSFRHMLLQFTHVVLFFAGIAVGALWAGFEGALIGIAVGRAVGYLPVALLIRKYHVWLPGFDAAVLLVSALVIGAGWALKGGI